ncbi:MAG: lipoate--protein ligase family protein [Candidatus Jordarchaeum sp.]|uniref:lipoate--protein ligase family protein n=1 Tax=Candidatus Jordarchaeum sp. TaxID=2823881 RepID=UPI00404B6BE7
MREEWRFLDLEVIDPPTSGAVGEAILLARSKNMVTDTLFLYQRDPPACSIGYFQAVENVVDVEECKKLGIDISRRITGGGAIYSDKQNLTYNIVVSEDNKKIPRDILKSYEVLCRGVVEGLKMLKLDAIFKPVNDILIDGRKISGSSQTRRKKVVLHHGTLLVKTDIETMANVLKVSKEKMSDKVAKSIEERVINLETALKEKPKIEMIKDILRKGFEKALDIELVPGKLTEYEKQLTNKLIREKYATRKWNFRR